MCIRDSPGDVHPLTRQHISTFLRYLPVDYVYGLRRVELRGRTSEEIGDPYGYYLNGEKTIVLFSVPPDLWQFPHTPGGSYWRFEVHDAEVEVVNDQVHVRWKRPVDLAYFFYREVFLHELGHHYHNQYRSRNKHPRYYAAKEASATRHAIQLAKRNKTFRLWHELPAG